MPELQLTVNGQVRGAPEGTTVAHLIDEMELDPQRVAVERNGDVVPRARWASTRLEDGDRLEIVTFVGGGA
jgi:thiamine biosynthesis protein ThiS